MGLFDFGKPRQKGITDYELKEHGSRLVNRFHAAFKGSFTSRKQKQAILDSALHMTGDRDYGMSSSQKGGIITGDEFESMVSDYESKGLFTKDEGKRLRDAAKDALSD